MHRSDMANLIAKGDYETIADLLKKYPDLKDTFVEFGLANEHAVHPLHFACDCVFGFNIWLCDLNDCKDVSDWKIMRDVSMSFLFARFFRTVIVFDILFVFCFDHNVSQQHIWCLDLISKKWYKSDY